MTLSEHCLSQFLSCCRRLPCVIAATILAAPLVARTNDGAVYLREAEKAELLGRFETARQLYEYALADDPNNTTYLAKVRDIHAKAPKIEKQSSQSPIILLPQNETVHNLDVNGRQAHSLYQEIGRMTGIEVNLDPTGIDSAKTGNKGTVFGEISSVSVEDALDYVAKVTNTSWKAVSSSAVYVTRKSVGPPSGRLIAPILISPDFDISGMSLDEGLRAAIHAGRLADVVRLVLQGADVNAPGTTPLRVAIAGHDAEIVRFLLERGASAKELNASNGRGLLHDVCAVGQADFISLLLEYGADLMQRDRSGQTPLNLALDYQNEKAVGVLFQLNGRHEEMLATAATAMEDATARGYTEIVQILLDNGLDVNKPTSKGSTYLGDAALKGQLTTVKSLLDHGAKLAQQNSFGDTALDDAALGGNGQVIVALLNRGADINQRNGLTEVTPLMIAAEMGHFDAVQVLVRNGADLFLKDRAGHSAYDLAKDSGNAELVQWLSESMRKLPSK